MLIFDIKIFHENLDLLRNMAGLNKAEFSGILGVKNVYRKDFKSIGSKLLMGINRHFEGVDETWLLTDHKNEKINIMLRKDVLYRQKPEGMIPQAHGSMPDSDRGSYGTPDLGGHSVRRVIASLMPDEVCLIEALREIGPIGRIGVYSAAINQLNEAKREKNIETDLKKREIIDKAIKALGRVISES